MAQLKHTKVQDSFIGYPIHKKNGLLAYMQPLIANLSDKVCCDDPCLDYTEVSHQYLEALINQVPVAVFCLDENLEISSVSPAAISWLKSHHFKRKKAFSSDDIVGRKFEDVFHPCPQPLSAAIANALKGKVWRTSSLKNSTSKHSSDYWLRCEVFPWLSQSHDVTDVIVFLEDITQKEELVLCNKKLQQSNELLESFNLIFSHDLIQPLRQISNFIDIIEEHYADIGATNDSMKEVFSALKKSFDHVRNLSEGIVMYCKNGDLTVDAEEIPLKQLIEEIYESSLKASKCQFNFQFPEDLCLFANRTCMLQLFQNLFANAIKHSPEENSIITLSAAKDDDDFYIFHLHNHGYCPSHIRRRNVFLPFESSSLDGAGLGLMICKKIISSYKGKIRLHSGKPRGTLVSFTLPASHSRKVLKN